MGSLPRIIAICGKKRCGKDTLANHIATTYGYTHVKIASHLKDVMGVLFGFSNTQLELDEKDAIDPRWGITPRQAMQFFGTDIMQYEIQKLLPHVGRTFWIQGLLQKYPEQKIVISDLRFPHEYNMIRSECCIVKIYRDSIQSTDAHSSETEFENIPHTILLKNNGSIQQLHSQFDTHVNQTKSHDDH